MKFKSKIYKTALLFAVFLLPYTILSAQQLNEKVTVRGVNLSLVNILEQIEKQIDLSFAYNKSQIGSVKKATFDLVEQPLQQVLNTVLKESGFTYKVEGDYIVIVPDTPVQQDTSKSKRSGIVTDEYGEAVIGANVIIKGTTTGIITDVNGYFELETPDNAVLAITYMGYIPAQVNTGTQKQFNIILIEDTRKLEEVVVVGYNTIKMGQVTGALKIVDGKELEYQSSPTLENRLQGKVPGIMISSGSGQPGSDNLQIRIRGTGSINGSNTPLYIMDGVMVEPGQFASLNSNDIEDIQVLKDASSTAIYGSRGANGVVVISTKKGTSGKTRFNYRNQFGFSFIPNYIEMMNSEQNIQYQLQCAISDSGREEYPLMSALWREYNGNATEDDIDRLAKARATDTDWIDTMSQTGFLTEHNLSASGGNDKTRFYLSGSYLNQEGILKKSALERYSGRFNIDHKANQYIEFGLKMTAGYSVIENSDPSGTTGRNGWSNPWFTALLAYPYESPDDWYNKDNPSLITKYYDREQRYLKAVWSAYLKVNILDWLSAKTNFGMDYMNKRSNTTMHRDHPNASGNKGSFYQDNYELARYTWTSTLNAVKDFKNGHSISAVVGVELFNGQWYDANFTGYDLNPNLMDSPAGIGDKIGASNNPPSVGGSSTRSNLLSYFGQVGYGIDRKYNFSGSLRYDTSSKFAKENRSTVFWSLGASWNMNEEEFLQDVEWLNMLRVRTSYGTTGNQDGVSDFGSFDGYGNVSYNGNSGYYHNQLGNPGLRWETSGQFNVGLDFSVFSQRLSGTVDLYHKKTKDLYMTKKISATSGFTQLTTNAGSVVNKGIEVSLNADLIRTKDLRWNLGVNFTYNKNELTDLGVWSNSEDKFQNGDVIYQKGKPLGTWSMVEWAGVNPNNGLVMFYDANGKTTENISDAPKVAKFKSSEVPYFGGFNTTISFKELTLSADFTYAFDYYVMNGSRWYLYNHHFNGNKPVEMLDMWMKPGDITDVPRFGMGTQPSPWASQFLEEASYLRFKNIRLTYTIPQKLIRKTRFFENISLYIQGENIYTWTSYTGTDPEVNGSQDMLSYPKPRNLTFGFDFNF